MRIKHMKHNYLLFALFISCMIKAQSFYKNALVFDLGGGIEIYNTKLQVHNSVSNKDTLQEDKTGNTHYTIGAEYGLHKNFGIGLTYRGSNYFVSKDTTGNGQNSVKGSEILLQLNYHAISTEKIDLILGADAGYSKINFNVGDVKNTKIWSNGIYYSFYVNPRVYFGRFGLNAKLYLPFFNYPNLESNNPDFTKDQSYKLSGIPGWGLNLGLQFRFLDEKQPAKKKEVKD